MTGDVVPFPKPEPRKRLSRPAWASLRARVVETQTCAGCGQWGRKRPAFDGDPLGLDAHHVYGRDRGGDDVFENLAPLHHLCHMTYEDRATGWEPIAAGVRRHVSERHGHLLYLIRKLGSSSAALAFLNRYYPESDRPTREEGEPDHAA